MKRTSTTVLLIAISLLAACGQKEAGEAQDAASSPSAYQETLMTQLIEAQPGDVIEIPAGTFHFNRGLTLNTDGVTLRGAGMDQTILSFKNQVQGAEGLFVGAS